MKGNDLPAITIRPFRPEDADVYTRFVSDPANTVLTDGRVMLPKTAAEVLRHIEMGQAHGAFAVLIWAGADDEPLGFSSLTNIDHLNRTVWTGSGVFEPSLRGRGLGTRGRRAMLDHLFNERNFRRAYGEFGAFNQASRRSHEKLGAEFVGVRRQRFFVSGRWHDAVTYMVRRERFNELFPPDPDRHFTEPGPR